MNVREKQTKPLKFYENPPGALRWRHFVGDAAFWSQNLHPKRFSAYRAENKNLLRHPPTRASFREQPFEAKALRGVRNGILFE